MSGASGDTSPGKRRKKSVARFSPSALTGKVSSRTSNDSEYGDGRIVVLSRRVTDSNLRGIGFLRQLLGNIGVISADQLFGN